MENTLEFDFKEVDSDAEERANEPDLLPINPEIGFFLMKTKWERYTRVSEPFLEKSEKEIFAHWIRPLNKEVCYGITNMRDDLKTTYLWMREHHKKPVEEVKTDLKVLKVKKYDVCHMSRMEYPEITVETEDGKDWVFTEADFWNVELSLFHRIIFLLKREPNRARSHTLGLEDINRHFRATLVQAYLYDLQMALESWRSKMNVKKHRRGLIGTEKEYALYSVIHDPGDTITCVYSDSKGKKRRMFCHEIALYSDGTLNIVLKKLKQRLHLDKMTFSVMEPHETLLAERFVKAIEERLEIRCQVRLAETILE